MLLAFLIAFGIPRAILFSRVLAALSSFTPCPPRLSSCPAIHVETAAAIATVCDDDACAGALIGLCAHESGCRVKVQVRGVARSVWQVEPRGEARKEDAARLEAEPLYAAQRALEAWGAGSGAYACGDARRCPDAAAELRRYVERAQWALAAQ